MDFLKSTKKFQDLAPHPYAFMRFIAHIAFDFLFTAACIVAFYFLFSFLGRGIDELECKYKKNKKENYSPLNDTTPEQDLKTVQDRLVSFGIESIVGLVFLICFLASFYYVYTKYEQWFFNTVHIDNLSKMLSIVISCALYYTYLDFSRLNNLQNDIIQNISADKPPKKVVWPAIFVYMMIGCYAIGLLIIFFIVANIVFERDTVPQVIPYIKVREDGLYPLKDDDTVDKGYLTKINNPDQKECSICYDHIPSNKPIYALTTICNENAQEYRGLCRLPMLYDEECAKHYAFIKNKPRRLMNRIAFDTGDINNVPPHLEDEVYITACKERGNSNEQCVINDLVKIRDASSSQTQLDPLIPQTEKED